jgi:diaminohydroxyphosphoribosylaminopyrimidine deaminase/5-amino-6-(5-phosphoribosylamino)uracil reductase
MSPDHQSFMNLAVKTAEKARGTCSPNPFVGAVIVKNGRVLARGWTQSYGNDHAEVHALKQAGEQARGADIYVTLEPCSHYGKTPPCTEAIIAAGLRNVFFGIPDPNPLVNQNSPAGTESPGILSLRRAGIGVHQGLLKEKISRQLESYLCRIGKRRPFVTWKAALSLDGKYAARDGSSRWITSERARRHVHLLRQGMDAVLTGIGTVLCDDPRLSVRLPRPRRQPVRVILDPHLDLPLGSHIASTLHQQRTLVLHLPEAGNDGKRGELKARGAQLFPIPGSADRLDLDKALALLYEQGFSSLMLECGSLLSSSFFAAKLVDKCLIYYGSRILGGPLAMLSELPLPDISAAILLRDTGISRFGGDFLLTSYPDYGPV